ncbi:MAG TPA: peptide chain release factor N(5)-glutamine methyltransferase [Sulfurimonas sp.]|nr:peptide chain release factor N(5)-glutamine methyltransferase [Sulfurimonas sp.]HIM76078.1 peptide chain release factor N(5)-glutamine methyltransferase [Campylobacterales bacterium]
MRSKYLVKELLKEITELLNPHIPRASREAQLLLMAHLNIDELWIITHQSSEVADTQKLFDWVNRRIKNEPFEYITNSVSFYSEEFFIKEGALIPRPETELLIDEVIKNFPDKESALTFVEVGVGSGIISVILARHFLNARFIAVDISQAALDIAKVNVDKFGLSERIELRLGSLLEPITEKVDYLVSNPPYIEDGVALESNLDYEPQNALFGGKVGDEIIKELLDEVLKQKIKFFTCEMGYDQQDKIRTYLENKNIESLEFYKDYSSFDRGFTLKVQT